MNTTTDQPAASAAVPVRKHFRAENANRRIAGIMFEPYDNFAGTVRGVFVTDDEALAKKIAAVPGVAEIDEATYEECRKKKAPAWSDFVAMNPPSPPTKAPPVLTALKGTGAVVADNPASSSPVKANETIQTVEDALKLDTVRPTEPVSDGKSLRKS